jgi:hypothetical protein
MIASASRQYTLLRLNLVLFVVLLLGGFSPNADAQRQRRVDQFTTEVGARCDEILGSVVDKKSLRAALGKAYELSDYVSAHAGQRQLDAMVRAESVRRLLELISKAQYGDPKAAADAFGQHPGFTTELGLLWKQKDNHGAVVRVAMELMEKRGEQVERYPALAAAICVVHDLGMDQFYTMRINENTPVGPGPVEIFDFFVANASTMSIAPDRLPAIDLVYVVDVSESVDQLQWAHNTYRANPGIDLRFFEIVYDTEHFRQGKIKRVTEAGNYSLTQIKKFGGVCADQAYYAMSVAKACGIPSGYVVAVGADVSHAWVGYLETRGRHAEWNFNAGRYPEYQKLRGNIRDPQTGQYISDGRLGIMGDAVSSTLSQVHASMAAGSIVKRMSRDDWNPPEQMELDTKGNARAVRTDSVEDRLSLLRLTLSKSAGVPSAWDAVIQIAESGDMSEEDLDLWSRAVLKLAGRDHQDFSFDFLRDLIATIDDPQRQHDMWEWAFGQFRARPDLAAAVRFEQGALWEKNSKPEMAWIAYQDILDQFLNDGPMSVNALGAMRELLKANDKRPAFLEILQDTARQVNRPDDMGSNFARQSNFYKINRLLVLELEYNRRAQEAVQLRRMINMPASDR